MDHEIEEAVGRGLSVIPIRADKSPFLPHWQQYQERPASLAQVREWNETLNPPAWAVVTGEVSGIAVLDFDTVHANGYVLGYRTAAKLGFAISDAHVVTPSGGLHLYLATEGHPKAIPTRQWSNHPVLNADYPGLDLKGEGGYAIFHGPGYEWINEPVPLDWGQTPIQVLEMLRRVRDHDALRQSPQGGGDVPPCNGHTASWEVMLKKALDKVRQNHGRNDSGFWLAQQLRDNCYEIDEAQEVMMTYQSQVRNTNTTGRYEPYRDRDALASLHSAYKYPRRRPWGPPR